MDELLRTQEKSTLHPDYSKSKIDSMETTRLYIVRAEYAGDVSLHIFFSDGTSQTVDFKPFILANPHPQYNRYIEPKNFKKFTIEHGNVVWGKNWDMIFPIEQLYRGVVA